MSIFFILFYSFLIYKKAKQIFKQKIKETGTLKGYSKTVLVKGLFRDFKNFNQFFTFEFFLIYCARLGFYFFFG